MIKELNEHYSFTTSASIHDEEALTALELAGRQGAKLNEVIRDQNNLRSETETHMKEQDNSITKKFNEQDSRLTNQENVQIPETVNDEIKRAVEDGTFEREIDFYAGGIKARVDRLLENVPSGSSTMDAEIIDARFGSNGVNYPNLGSAIRDQFYAGGRHIHDMVYKKSKNLFDLSNQPVSIKENPYFYGEGIPYTKNDSIQNAYSATNLFELQPEKTYTIGLVPGIYSNNNKPWYTSTSGIFFYDSGGSFLGSSNDATFTTPQFTKYARFNVYYAGGLSYNMFASMCMLVEGDTLPSVFEPFNAKFLDDVVNEQVELVEELTNIIRPASFNLYDPSLQTESTIEPHYYVSGKPYVTTDFDHLYHCTAPIPVEGGTQYTIGLVPGSGEITKPWFQASSGLHFYDAEGNVVGDSNSQTFITPAATAYLRFNFYVSYVPLNTLNAKCMLVKGDKLPDAYEGYGNNDPFNFENGKIYYNITERSVLVNAHYNNNKDISFLLECDGGNNFFDFKRISLIANDSKIVTKNFEGYENLFMGTTDWFAPYVMRALNNANGDMISSGHFTGGNHCYTNGSSGGTPTGRTISVRAFVDGKQVNGTGYCNTIRIEWANRVQAYNTKKADGSGREVLEERHTLIFDGEKWSTYSELEPLEDIVIERYYGLQCSGTSTIYKNIRFIGCEKRGLFSGTKSSYSGQPDTIGLEGFGDDHKIIMEIDPTYDLGKREFIGDNAGVFVESYGKAYNQLILNKQLNQGDIYRYRGSYIFKPV